jgi:hypothetical protein
MDGVAECPSLDAEDSDPRLCPVGRWLQFREPSVVGVQCFDTRYVGLHGSRTLSMPWRTLLVTAQSIYG